MKILNLYAGIGGNRKLWVGDIKVTAIEINPKVAKIYKDFFPKDKVVVGDAHQFLLEHYNEFDFIWSSPPCPTHSRMRLLCNQQEGKTTPYPDMQLYQEIIFLKHWFKGKWVVENVISYYEPLIAPFKVGNHFYWSNFVISDYKEENRMIIRMTDDELIKDKFKRYGYDFDNFELTKRIKVKMLNNVVEPKTGLHIFNMAFKDKQQTLGDDEQ
jgi:DNA (cytosine-5)-methyltransferase 1